MDADLCRNKICVRGNIHVVYILCNLACKYLIGNYGSAFQCDFWKRYDSRLDIVWIEINTDTWNSWSHLYHCRYIFCK